jgi:hypothetical protein
LLHLVATNAILVFCLLVVTVFDYGFKIFTGGKHFYKDQTIEETVLSF